MTVRDAVEVLRRAAEGGAFVDATQEETVERAKSLVGELPEGLEIVDGWASAVFNGQVLAGKLGNRLFLARKVGT